MMANKNPFVFVTSVNLKPPTTSASEDRPQQRKLCDVHHNDSRLAICGDQHNSFMFDSCPATRNAVFSTVAYYAEVAHAHRSLVCMFIGVL